MSSAVDLSTRSPRLWTEEADPHRVEAEREADGSPDKREEHGRATDDRADERAEPGERDRRDDDHEAGRIAGGVRLRARLDLPRTIRESTLLRWPRRCAMPPAARGA